MLDSWVKDFNVFQTAPELDFPWYVREYKFDHEGGRLDIWLGFREPTSLTCSVCQTPEQRER